MRLIRTILVLAGAGFLLPSPPEESVQHQAGQPPAEVSTFAMLSSATSAVSDVASFCVRQPDVCATATYVAGKLEAKAKYSARLIYEWATDASRDPATSQPVEAQKVDFLTTGATRLAAAEPPPEPETEGQSTLKIEDIIPEWRGPVTPRKKEG